MSRVACRTAIPIDRHFPDRREKVLNGLRDLKEGRLNDSQFKSRMAGTGPTARHLRDLFQISCRRAGMMDDFPELSAAAFRRPSTAQLELWQT